MIQTYSIAYYASDEIYLMLHFILLVFFLLQSVGERKNAFFLALLLCNQFWQFFVNGDHSDCSR